MVKNPCRRKQVETQPIRHLVLFGEYELTIDDKNRMLIPSDIRRLLDSERDGEAFFLVFGTNKRPWLYPERQYERMVAKMQQELAPSEDALEFDQMVFGMASRLEWDKQGRVLIPERTLKRTGLNKEVTLVGVRDHLELWNRNDWEAHREALLNRSSEIAFRARQARPGISAS